MSEERYHTMTPEERRARTLVADARTAVVHGDHLAASHLFRKAGNFFKLDHRWQWAGVAFQEAGELKAPLEAHAPTNPLRSVRNAAPKFGRWTAVVCLETAAEILADAGEFRPAAWHYNSLVGMVAPQDADTKIRYWETAARLHEADDRHWTFLASNAWMAAGEWLARKGDYTAAIDRFEWLAHRNATAPTQGQYRQRLRAVLCYLCRDGPEAAKKALERCEERLPPSGRDARNDRIRRAIVEAMGGAGRCFTARSIARTLQTPDSSADGRMDTWTRIMLERAWQLLRNAEEMGRQR
ncbi:alpha-soluble NSF attachment protein-like [Paramacrobiotus metropolitanus]|uniref:alpha-soluble NSF attachment protein-like n=1 Tax=Paramacrobiotus metropolitanus TaxID=2943436 RepID=UPI002446277D|nr:alpha-soluble NSF attachment protein-like [Paramacrobiotus metropolitanus]